jgi:hypothetical protein
MVAKKLAAKSQDLHRVVVDFAWQFSRRVTHFVFQGKQNDFTKEFRAAKEAGCSVVPPHIQPQAEAGHHRELHHVHHKIHKDQTHHQQEQEVQNNSTLID